MRKSLIAAVLLCFLLLTGCSTTASRTYNVDTGDQIKFTVSTSDGYKLEKGEESPLVLTKDGKNIFNISFGYVEDFEERFKLAASMSDVTFVQTLSVKDGGQYFAFYLPDGDRELTTYAVFMNNTTILMIGIGTEHSEAAAAFNSLTLEFVKGDAKQRDPVLVTDNFVAGMPGTIPATSSGEGSSSSGHSMSGGSDIVSPQIQPGSGEGQEANATPSTNTAEIALEDLSFATYNLVKTGYSSAYMDASFNYVPCDLEDAYHSLCTGEVSYSDLASYFEEYIAGTGASVYSEDDSLLFDMDPVTIQIRKAYDGHTCAELSVFMDDGTGYDISGMSGAIATMTGLSITDNDLTAIMQFAADCAKEENSNAGYSVSIEASHGEGNLYVSVGTGYVSISVENHFE